MAEATAIAGRGEEFRDDVRRGLPAEAVKRLTALSPWRACAACLHTVGVAAACIAAALLWWHPLVVVPAILVIATRQQALFVLVHEAAHYRLFGTRWLNDLAGRACGTVVGISMGTYRVIHRLHHNHLYGEQDPDIPLHGGYPRGRAYLMRKLAKDLCGLTAWKTYAYFFGAPALNVDVGVANRPLDDTSPRLRLAARRDRWVVAGFHAAAPALAFALGWGVEYLVLWVLPLLTVLQPILRLRAICEHGAVVDLATPLTAARTNTGAAWLRWALFPHHVNHHIEHHLYPSIPHYNLPAAHAELRRAGVLEGAEVVDIAETLKKIFAEPAAGYAPAGA